MTALYIVGGIIALAALICAIPAGVEAKFDDNGFSFAARVWFVSIRLGGGKKEKSPNKEKKPKAEKKPLREDGETADKPKASLPALPVLKMLAKRGFRMLGRIVSAIRVDTLRIWFTSAFDDPATAAMAYGAAGTAMETLLRLGEERIAHPDLRADVDFEASEPRLEFLLRLTIRVGRLLGAVLGFGFGFLRDFIPYKIRTRKG